MKSALCLVLICFASLAVKGQSVRDSLVSKTWMGGLADYLKFDTVKKEAFFMFCVSSTHNSLPRYRYRIDDTTITLTGMRSIDDCKINLKYQYFGDSLVLDIISVDRSCIHCNLSNKEYQRQLLLKPKPQGSNRSFEKLTLTNGGAHITLDSTGSLFLRVYYTPAVRGFLGDYRGELYDSTFQKIEKLNSPEQDG